MPVLKARNPSTGQWEPISLGSAPANMLTTDTEQTITARKTLLDTLTMAANKGIHFAQTAGSAAYVMGSSATLRLRGGSAGIYFLNNADTVHNFVISDLGVATAKLLIASDTVSTSVRAMTTATGGGQGGIYTDTTGNVLLRHTVGEGATYIDFRNSLVLRSGSGASTKATLTSTTLDVPGARLHLGTAQGNNGIWNGFQSIATYAPQNVSLTGAIVFIAPYDATGHMQRHEIVGYNYSTQSTWSLDLSLYNFNNSGAMQFVNPSVVYHSDFKPTVRIARVTLADGVTTRLAIIIGDVTSAWSYPKVAITRSWLGHTNVTTPQTIMDGWTVELRTDVTTSFTNMTTPTNRSLAGVGSPHDATLVHLAGAEDITGNKTLRAVGNEANASPLLYFTNRYFVSGTTYADGTVSLRGTRSNATNVLRLDGPLFIDNVNLTDSLLRLGPRASITSFGSASGVTLLDNLYYDNDWRYRTADNNVPAARLSVGGQGLVWYTAAGSNTVGAIAPLTPKFSVSTDGAVSAFSVAAGIAGFGAATPAAGVAMFAEAAAASHRPVLIRGAVGQTANLLEAQNSGGTLLAGIDSLGRHVFNVVQIASSATTGGAAALPAAPQDYIIVTLSNGVTRKIPAYN